MKPFRILQTSFETPENIEDCTEVYDDPFDDIGEPCEMSPNGQCEYSWRDDWKVCIHCKRESGL